MRKTITLFMFAAFVPSPALATDDFGTRFSGRTPTSLSATPSTEDKMEDLYGKRLQAIEPAAGDETPVVAPVANPQTAIQPSPQETVPSETPVAAPPATVTP